jgi:hypothetical protein
MKTVDGVKGSVDFVNIDHLAIQPLPAFLDCLAVIGNVSAAEVGREYPIRFLFLITAGKGETPNLGVGIILLNFGQHCLISYRKNGKSRSVLIGEYGDSSPPVIGAYENDDYIRLQRSESQFGRASVTASVRFDFYRRELAYVTSGKGIVN